MKKAIISIFLLLVFTGFAHSELNIELLGIIEGENNGDGFGSCVANLGDINGDGFEDFGVGASHYPERSGTGRVYIYLGTDDFDLSVDLIVDNPGGVRFWGRRVSGIKDISGDGIDEFLISAVNGVFLFYGGEELNNQPDMIFYEPIYYFGQSVASGDVNNDGYWDLIITGGGPDSMYVYLGSEEMDTIPDFVLCGKSLGMDGIAVGDVNGDGYDDIAAAEYQDSLYLFYGRDSLHSTRDLAFAHYGGLPAIGDVNGDDFEDLICYYHLYYGSTVMDTITDVWLRKARGAIAIGELNRDRYSDILGQSYGVVVASRANIYLGGAEVDTIVDWWWEENIWDAFASDMDCVDMNADGVDEFLVSSRMWPYERLRGRVHVFAGDTAWTAVADQDWTVMPDDVDLLQNYPNPFNSRTCIRFLINSRFPLPTSVCVYNSQGQLVKTLLEMPLIAGRYHYVWDGTDYMGGEASSGIYFIVLKSGDIQETCKAILMR